jgi:hypothetical protein
VADAGNDDPAVDNSVDLTNDGGNVQDGDDGDGDDIEPPRTSLTLEREPRDYEHLHATLERIVMTQFNLKQGLKHFGQEGKIGSNS